MGHGQKRLIVQADLTGEEDPQFLAWIKQLQRRRGRLAEAIREGLRLQYEQQTRGSGHKAAPWATVTPEPEASVGQLSVSLKPGEPGEGSGNPRAKLDRLLGSF